MTIETWDVSNPAKPIITHDPDAELDYSENWAAWLATVTDTIVGFTPTPNGTMTVLHSEHTDTIVTAWLTGGIAGATESVTFSIVTSQGRKDDRTLFFKIKDR